MPDKWKALTIVCVAGLALTACTQPAGTGLVAEGITPTTSPAEPSAAGTTDERRRTLEVNWERAAQTSAGGLEREIAPLRITVPLPTGWTTFERWALLKRSAIPPTGTGMTFERPLALYADRCAWADPNGLIEIGPTVDDLVDALIEHPQYGATNVREITVDGFAGKEFDMLGAPDDLDLTQCSPGNDYTRAPHLHRPWAGRHWMGPTEINRVRVLDVDGDRVVIRALYFAGTSEDDLAELLDMLNRIEIATQE
jgi:hypothetical protein